MKIKKIRIRFTLTLTMLILIALPAVASAAESNGVLVQKAGTDACVSEDGSGGDCANGVGLDVAFSATVSPDGKSVYVASFFDDSVAVFDRNTTTGVLTQKGGTEACVSENGSGGDCTDGMGLDGASSVTVSPDGKSVYVASSNSKAVAVFDRDT
ncbi:MAG: beta-propeller fold lactonase family protein, partial [Solirubrobacterales bacterium]